MTSTGWGSGLWSGRRHARVEKRSGGQGKGLEGALDGVRQRLGPGRPEAHHPERHPAGPGQDQGEGMRPGRTVLAADVGVARPGHDVVGDDPDEVVPDPHLAAVRVGAVRAADGMDRPQEALVPSHLGRPAMDPSHKVSARGGPTVRTALHAATPTGAARRRRRYLGARKAEAVRSRSHRPVRISAGVCRPAPRLRKADRRPRRRAPRGSPRRTVPCPWARWRRRPPCPPGCTIPRPRPGRRAGSAPAQ